MEKDIVLEFSTALARPARTVRQIPRGDDAHRRHLHSARRPGPDGPHPAGALFVSIHADAIGKGEGEAQGATIYTLSETASDAEAGRLAETENRADVIAGIDMSHEPGDVADILIDLAQRETKAFSLHFAKTLVADMKKWPGCTRTR
jgi:N-acetylmuramoyl-L-alanine amidase